MESRNNSSSSGPSKDGAAAAANDADHGEKAETASGSTAETIELEVIDGPRFESLLKERRGRVVLVDFWATWCPSCVKQMPHTVELHEKYHDQGLTVITVSLDDPESQSKIPQVLRAGGANMKNYVSAHGGSEKSMETFQIEGGLPHYQLYDREGNLHRTFATGQENIDVEEISRAVASLVGA